MNLKLEYLRKLTVAFTRKQTLALIRRDFEGGKLNGGKKVAENEILRYMSWRLFYTPTNNDVRS